MIKCKKCGCENITYELFCRECSEEYKLSDVSADELRAAGESAYQANDYITAVDIYKFLAALGDTQSEVEFAKILEGGLLVPRDLDMATSYFYSAAKSADPYAAYRYSRLISRINEDCGFFWLKFSAICGLFDAYNDAHAYYSSHGDESSSSYYCAHLALKGDSDAIVEMARRHLYGIGVEQNEHYAKWYMEKLTIVPLYAIKLSNRLRRTESSVKPPEPVLINKDKILRSLIADAKRMELRKIVAKLSELFAKTDAPDASVALANLYIEGVELEEDVERGISLLEEAMKLGSAMGAKCLGDLFAIGRHVERDLSRAIGYYRHAATLGSDGAYESIGDIFCDGVFTEPEVAFALSLYEKGAIEGDKNCKLKAEEIKRKREADYNAALPLEDKSPEEAFRLLKLSIDAGFLPAHSKIGKYYENGIATQKDRKAAFLHYKAAVDSGDVSAYYDLGRCYSRGIGVAFNFALASDYLSKARDQGNRDADRELFRIYENKKKHMIRALYSTAMRIFYQGKFSSARELFEVTARLGSGDATYTLGCLYEFGIDVPTDRRCAILLYKKAAAKGYIDKNQAKKQFILKTSKRVSRV